MTMPEPQAAVPNRPDGRVVFETPRLIGRHLVAGDADAKFAVYGDAGAMRRVGDGNPLERGRCGRWPACSGDVRHNADGSQTQLFAWRAGSGQNADRRRTPSTRQHRAAQTAMHDADEPPIDKE